MSNFNQDKNEIKKKANDVYENGKKYVSDFYEDNKEKAEAMVGTLKDAASNLYDEGKKNYQTAEQYMSETTDELIKSIRAKPLTSVLVAGAVGWLLSSLLKK